MNRQANGLLSNTHGNAIVLSLPLSIIVIAVIQLTMLQSSNFNSAITNFRAVGGRDSLAANLRMYSSLPTTFRSSLHPSHSSSMNSELQNCVFGGLLPCTAGVELPVTLFSPMSSSSASPSLPIHIIAGPTTSAGSTPQAALYDMKGNLCTEMGTATERCPFEVTANFIATCAGGAATCASAQSIAVHYFIHYVRVSNSQKIPLRDFIDQVAPAVSVASILPPAPDSSNGNILVSSLTGLAGTSSVLLTQISESIKSVISGATDDEAIAMAQAFFDAGYTDLGFINTVAPLLYPQEDIADLIKNLGALGITDVATASMFAQAGISDPSWMKQVLDAGITDPLFVQYMYYERNSYSTVEELKTAYNSVQGLPKDLLTLSVSTTIPVSQAAAQSLYNTAISFTPDIEVAANLVSGDWYKDPAKATAIVTAVAGMPSAIAGPIAYLGITDTGLAKQIQSAVSVLDDEGKAREIIARSGGDLQAIQTAVQTYLAGTSATTSTKVTATTTTTTTTTASAPSGISLLSTCTTCSGVSF